MVNEIMVQGTAQGFTATFYGPKAAEIVNLFGTNVLPLPLGQYAPTGLIEELVAKLKHNWPGFRIGVV